MLPILTVFSCGFALRMVALGLVVVLLCLYVFCVVGPVGGFDAADSLRVFSWCFRLLDLWWLWFVWFGCGFVNQRLWRLFKRVFRGWLCFEWLVAWLIWVVWALVV